MVNYRLKAQLLEVVDHQVNTNDPKCTKHTLERLVDEGFGEIEAKQMIASVLVEEMNDVMKTEVKFNEERYGEKLAKLPDYMDELEAGESQKDDKQQPIQQPKVGRNDPCPCGSGKKYKKCCGK
ncbi:SEC-C metal-binding domain-containing protein [Aquibacillus sediminis]|uniref:SEC-C metal-binding domain-containing protein n=1 Tax=Aquibacillus sediminis TaxID=2574734 RepID=UPI002482D2C0|nr:SEC-C metal-binding domain-containing protein [Aquibacillus sediminis]